MPDNQDITLKIFVIDAQGQFRGGTADVEFKHRTLSDHGKQRGLDASREINIAGCDARPRATIRSPSHQPMSSSLSRSS
jgi:hypothetical protein